MTLSPPLQIPTPDPDALAHSEQLRAVLAERIRTAAGWLDFADFMDGLLYTPGLGYYAAGAARFQAAGDFITAPETSPLFGRTLARALAPVLRALPEAVLLEPGAGTGRLAATLLIELARLEALPASYAILEPSPSLRAEQHARLAALPAALAARVQWLEDLPADFTGIVLANEVLDAMPVHLLRRIPATPDDRHSTGPASPSGPAPVFRERGVALDPQGGFCWVERPAPAALQAQVAAVLAGNLPAPGNLFEFGAAAGAWARTVAGRLRQGAMVLIDYGHAARELHHPQRSQGTLMCHYRHHAHHDPFHLPGLEDVTAHVDFTAIGRALMDGGMALHEFNSQGAWLLQSGLLDCLDPAFSPGSLEWLRQSTELQTLVHPSEMGESFKVLVAIRDPHGTLGACLAGPGPVATCARLGIPV